MTIRNPFEQEARKIRESLLKMDQPGPWTAKQVFDKIIDVMHLLPGMETAMRCLDYAMAEEYGEWAVKPHSAEAWEEVYRCYGEVNTGGSEGVYIDMYCHESFQAAINRISFGTFKTLRDDFEAYILMGQISGAFTKLFEEWQWANRMEVWETWKEKTAAGL